MLTLVTGATGTVGYNIVKSLLARGRQVRLLVRDLKRAKSILPEDCVFVQGDITDIESLRKAMQGCDIVHHAAGLPEQWFKDPSVFDRVNVQGTKNVLMVAKELAIKKLVYTSTIDVFQAGAHEEYDESVLDPNPKGTHYERSKQAADRAVVSAIEDGLNAVFIHPAGVYGPGPDIEGAVGVNAIVTKVNNNEIPVLLPGGFPVVYSEDVGEAHVRAEAAHCGARFILSERYITLKALVEAIHPLLGIARPLPKVMPVWVGKMIAQVGEWLAAIINRPPLIAHGELTFLQWQAIPIGLRAQDELGIEYTTLEQGLKQTIDLRPA